MSTSTVMPPKMTPFDDEKNTRLHFAAARGHLEDATRELDEGQKPDTENYMGWTPLMMATRNGHVEMVKFLLERRADATKINKLGGSILLVAVSSGKLELVSLIVDHLLCGGVSRQSMESLFSPISISIMFNHANIFRYLLEKSFNVNAISHKLNLTPFMFATMSESKTFKTMLLAKGANASVQNCNGLTAEDILNEKYPIKLPEAPKQTCLQHPHVPQVVVFGPQILGPPPATQTPIPMIRKSSDVATPNFMMTPNFSPMGFMPQMFFPSDFSPSHFNSPSMGFSGREFLGANQYPQNMIISPLPALNMAIPCGNLYFQNEGWVTSPLPHVLPPPMGQGY